MGTAFTLLNRTAMFNLLMDLRKLAGTSMQERSERDLVAHVFKVVRLLSRSIGEWE
jgi:hypothetical protein